MGIRIHIASFMQQAAVSQSRVSSVFASLLSLLLLLLLPSCEPNVDRGHDGRPGPSAVVTSSVPVTPANTPVPILSARPSSARAADVVTGCRDTLLIGSIGSNPIVMELRVCGEQVGGRYYYRSNSESLLLFGTLKRDQDASQGRLELAELGADGQPFKPNGARLWGKVSLDEPMLIHDESASWQRKGKTLPWEASQEATGETYSSLRRVAGQPERSVDGSFMYRTVKHVWEYLRCESEGVAPPGPIELFPNAAPDFHAPDCGGARRVTVEATWPEVLSAQAKLDVATTNRTLVSLLNGYAPFPAEAAGGSTSTRVVTARGRVLSFIVQTEGIFQGPYPDHTQYGVTIDLRDGRRMLTSDLLDLPEPSEFAALLEKRVPLQSLGDGEPCSWADLDLKAHIGEAGLQLTPDFPHVAKACQYANIGRLLPRDLALRHARAGSLLQDVLAGRWGP